MILDDEVGILEPMSSDGVSKKKEEGEKEFLSQIIEKLNTTFGSQITEGDGVYLGMVKDGLENNEELGLIISSNSSSDSKKDEFNKYFDKEMVELYTEGFEFYKKMENKELKSYIQRIMFDNMMKQSELSKRL
jgi:type I restriction enzyme R subunit